MTTIEQEKFYPHWTMQKFAEEAWPQIFSRVLLPETKKRWSFVGSFGDTTIRIYELAARVMVTFERDKGESQVTYITHDRDANGDAFGLQGYEGTYWQHIDMISDVARRITAENVVQFFRLDTKQRIG